MSESLWGIVIIAGPMLLAIGLLYATLNNKRSAREKAATEAATRRMYDQQNAEDTAGEPR